MKHSIVVRAELTYASYVRVIHVVKSHADSIGLAVLFLASVFPEKRAKREGESGVFSSSPIARTQIFLLHLQGLDRLLSLVVVEPSSVLGENKQVAAPEANSLAAICRWRLLLSPLRPPQFPPPHPHPYKHSCICFLLVWNINYTPVQLPAPCVVVAGGKTNTHWRRSCLPVDG